MLPENVRALATETHRGVLTTFRRNGAAQMSIISCGPVRAESASRSPRPEPS